ncbi:MAG: sugar transporter [Anaerolineaceae bacterium]|nr:sugar transporter [Anaerolineaceae bacterium]
MSSQPLKKLSRRDMLKLLGIGAAGAMMPSLGSRILAQGIEPVGEITIWDRAGDLFQVIDAAIPAFNEKYPDIIVNHQAFETSELAPTLVSGVNVPDGAFIEDEFQGTISQHLLDITEWMQPYVDDLVNYKVAVNTYDGQIKGIPYDVDPAMLFYRADILEENGINIDDIVTYDDLIDAAVKLKEANPEMYPIHMETTPGLIVLWVSMLANQQDASIIDANGELSIETDEFLNIMNFIKKAIDADVANMSSFVQPGDIAACDQDIQVFYPWAIWFNYQVDALLNESRGKWRVAPLPVWSENGARTASMGGSSFVIPAGGANPELAWLFYEYMMLTVEGISAAFGPNEIYPGGITTVIPAYKPAFDVHLMENPESLGGQDLYTFATELVNEIPSNYYFPTWYSQLADFLGANVQRLQAGEITPEEVLSRSASEIRSNLMR